MTVISPCHTCEGRGYIVSPTGQRQKCQACNGRGHFASTDVSAMEAPNRQRTGAKADHLTGDKSE